MLNKLFKDKRVIVGTIIIVILVLILLITFISNGKIKIGKPTDGELIEKEYKDFDGKENEYGEVYTKVELVSDNKLKYSTVSEVVDIFDNRKDAVVFFSSPTCAFCRSAIEVLSDVSTKMDIDTIYYLDLETTDKDYDKLLDKLDDRFFYINEEENLRVIYKPLVLFIVDGSVVSYKRDTIVSQRNPYEELSEVQIKSLSFIYESGINDVLNSIKLKKEAVK